MQPQKKKSHTVVLLIGWLIILGSYLLIRLAFILFGLHLRSEALGVCLAVSALLLHPPSKATVSPDADGCLKSSSV